MTIQTFRDAVLQYSDIIVFETYYNDTVLEITLRNKTGRNAIYEGLASTHLPDFKCITCQLEPSYYKAGYILKN